MAKNEEARVKSFLVLCFWANTKAGFCKFSLQKNYFSKKQENNFQMLKKFYFWILPQEKLYDSQWA